MRYYATASGTRVREAMRAGLLGMIATPAAGNTVPQGIEWCADNGCFTPGRYPGDDAYLRWLAARRDRADRCAFATAPDVVSDTAATLRLAIPMLERIRAVGFPAALVLQDGQEHLPVPWDLCDAAFIGGSTAWKLGPAAAGLAAQARARGCGCTWAASTACAGCSTPHRSAAIPLTARAWPTARIGTCLRFSRGFMPSTRPRSRTEPTMTSTRFSDQHDRHDHGHADDGAQSASVWTEQRIRALGAITDVPTAGRVFGLGRAMSYELVRAGRFPVPVIRVGSRHKVAVAAILTALGIPVTPGDLTPAGQRRVDHHDEISSIDPPHAGPDHSQGEP